MLNNDTIIALQGEVLMISFLRIFLVSAILVGCAETTQPTRKQKTAASSAIQGRALLYEFTYDSSEIGDKLVTRFAKDNSGIVVEVIGTAVKSVSDSAGNFLVGGLDSGSYRLQFVRDGYDTLVSNVVKLGDNDTAYAEWTVADPKGVPRSGKVFILLQRMPTVVTELVEASVREQIDSVVGNQGEVTRRDTSYYFSGNCLMHVIDNDFDRQRLLWVCYMYCVSDKPVLSATDIPTAFPDPATYYEPHSKGFITEYAHVSPPRYYPGDMTRRYYAVNKEPSSIRIDISEYIGKLHPNLRLNEHPNLYLHFVAVYRTPSKQWLEHPGGGYTGGPFSITTGSWSMAPIYTTQIPWE